MKPIQKFIAGFVSLVMMLFVSISSLAQEGGGTDIKVDINKETGNDWYNQPWVWVVGVAVFILLLVALLRGNRRTE